MSISEGLLYVLNNYLKLEGNKSNSKTQVYNKLCKDTPADIRKFLNDDKYIVKGSMGQGNRTEYPWISILDKSITTSTQKGLYVVFLFKKDMSGLYLTLNQGITNFKNLYGGRNMYINAKKTAEYFKSEIDGTSFSKKPIKLGGSKSDLGYGYEEACVLQKYYSKSDVSEKIIKEDLKELLDVYSFITKHFLSSSYDEVIEYVLETRVVNDIGIEKAVEQIKNAVDPDDETPYGFFRKVQIVEPKAGRTNKLKRITNPKLNKIDYIKKQEKDSKCGLLGEQLVLSYEQERLVELGLEEYADKIEWRAEQDDSAGYDIKSYDLNSKGKVYEIIIEVKTSRAKVDTEFFISKNEVETSKKNADHYFLYRIYDAMSEHPKMYRVKGSVEDHFILDPYNFTARYKGKSK